LARNKASVLKDILLYSVPAAVFFILVFAAGMFIAWAFLISAGVFAALLFLLNPKTKVQQAKEVVGLQVKDELEQTAKLILKIRATAGIVENPCGRQEIAQSIRRIAELSESVKERFLARDEIALPQVSIIKSYLQLIDNILTEYSEILLGRTAIKTPEEKQELIKSVETVTIPEFAKALENMAVSLDKGDVSGLKIAIDTLSQLLKDRGLIQ